MIPRSRRFYVVAAVCVTAILLIASSLNLADRWVTAKYEPQTAFDGDSWLNAETSGAEPSMRQLMIRHLITNVLRGKDRHEIESLLGESPSHEEMRRYTQADLNVREKDDEGNWKPFPRTGIGHYFDELDWDLIYPIGREQILIYDHKGQRLSPDEEHLIIRLDEDGRFDSWYIEGSTRWRRILGREVLPNFCRARTKSTS